MTDNFIQLEKSDVLRLGIKTDDGKDTGEYLEFDLMDIELLLKCQEIIEKSQKNKNNFKNQLLLISKRPDIKNKKLLSKNEEDELKASRDFVNKQIELYNMFLGKNGVQKLLNGRKPTWFTLEKVDKILAEQILPLLKKKMASIDDIIKAKYKQQSDEEIEVL